MAAGGSAGWNRLAGAGGVAGAGAGAGPAVLMVVVGGAKGGGAAVAGAGPAVLVEGAKGGAAALTGVQGGGKVYRKPVRDARIAPVEQARPSH